MSGQQFIETLRQIGYPKANSLSPRALDWMFEDEAVLPFLSWFCNTVGHQNVLSLEEKEAFQELERKGEGILEGSQLEEALACLSSTQDDVSTETLREDIGRLKEDLERHKKHKQRLIQARNKLSLHHTGLTHRLSKLGDIEMEAKHRYKDMLNECRHTNAENTRSLEGLVGSTKRLLAFYQDSCPSTHADAERQNTVFLSQLPLDNLHQCEEKFTRALTGFTKKQFFEGIADIAGGEISRYELLEVSNPTSLLVKGQSEEEFKLDCQELARLQAVFPKSESDRMNAFVEEKCATSVLEMAEEILQSLYSGHFPKETMDISRRLDETKASLAVSRQELRRLTEDELPPLVRELATLQGTTVLGGDYRLKLARQDYFTTNQDQVIQYLMEQRARNEFLTMAYEVEARNHRDIHHLITAIQQTLSARLASHDQRMKIMGDPALTKARHERGTIDTRDTASTCLHRILVPVDERMAEKQLFLSFAQMVSAAQTLKLKHTAARADAFSTADKYQDKIKQLEKEVRRCENVLYAESSTVGGQPMMTPRVVQESMTELSDMLQKLEAAILDTISDINTKKKSLKKDALQTKERELFTYFHLHPDRLRSTIDKLEERLQAQSVS